jgi:hypothetical protein
LKGIIFLFGNQVEFQIKKLQKDLEGHAQLLGEKLVETLLRENIMWLYMPKINLPKENLLQGKGIL